MKGCIIVCTTLLLYLTSGFANPNLHLEKIEEGYLLQVTIPQWHIVDQKEKRDCPFRILSPGLEQCHEPGSLNVPFFSFYLALTDESSLPSFEVIDHYTEEISASLPNGTQSRSKQCSAAIKIPVSSLIQTGEVFSLRGIPCVKIYVRPFNYDKTKKCVLATTQCTIKIKTQKPKKRSVHSKAYTIFLNYLLINGKDCVSPIIDKSAKDSYVIICDPSFESTLAKFVSFRQERFSVSLVSTNQTGTNTDAIQQYIKSIQPPPSFLLLVGDTEHIPPCDVSSRTTDLYYANTEGDYHPEIFLGRFSISNTTELTNIINKTIYMEKNLYQIYKRNMFITQRKMSPHQPIVADFKKAGFENVLYCLDSLTHAKDSIMATLNAGVIFNIYAGHSSQDSWGVGDASFRCSDVHRLTNTTSFPFTYSFSCLTGKFDRDECLAEAFIRAKGGAVAAIGASISTTWTPDENLERGIFEAIFDETNPQTSLSASLNAGKMSNSSSNKTYFEVYNLLGDPALEVFPIISKPYISLLSPNGGETIEKGTTYTITWHDNISQKVSIYCVKAGMAAITIAEETESDGLFEWNVPHTIPTGNDYTLKIRRADSTGLVDSSDAFFTIIPSSSITSKSWQQNQFNLIYANNFLSYSLPEEVQSNQTVTITLYTVQGRQIQTISHQAKVARHYSHSLASLGSGIVICRIEVGSQGQTARFVLDK